MLRTKVRSHFERWYTHTLNDFRNSPFSELRTIFSYQNRGKRRTHAPERRARAFTPSPVFHSLAGLRLGLLGVGQGVAFVLVHVQQTHLVQPLKLLSGFKRPSISQCSDSRRALDELWRAAVQLFAVLRGFPRRLVLSQCCDLRRALDELWVIFAQLFTVCHGFPCRTDLAELHGAVGPCAVEQRKQDRGGDQHERPCLGPAVELPSIILEGFQLSIVTEVVSSGDHEANGDQQPDQQPPQKGEGRQVDNLCCFVD